MTVPTMPGVPAPAPPPAAQPFEFPLSWLLSKAISPIQYRATTEVARLTGLPASMLGLPYSYAPALSLALAQRSDGTWNGAMLTVPSARAEEFEGVGTIPAVRRMVEYGWDRESPPLVRARRASFRLLAEDDDASLLYELSPRGSVELDVVRHGRGILREAAAATLAQAGYEGIRDFGVWLVALSSAWIAFRRLRISKPNAKAASEALRSSAFSSLSIFILGATMFPSGNMRHQMIQNFIEKYPLGNLKAKSLRTGTLMPKWHRHRGEL